MGIVLILTIGVSSLFPCSGGEPAALIGLGNELKTLQLPERFFRFDVHRILELPEAGHLESGYLSSDWDSDSDAWAVDSRELEEVGGLLAARNPTESERAELLSEYSKIRKANRVPTSEATPKVLTVLPDEFRLYMEGAQAYRSGNLNIAIVIWEHLLALPADQRHYRSAWAAYMLGKIRLKQNSTECRTMFALTRSLQDEGFADCLGLAIDSLGWEAKFSYDRNEYLEALKLYVTQMEQGGSGSGDLESIEWCCERLLEADALDPRVADVPVVRRLITAWITAKASPSYEFDAGDFAERWNQLLVESHIEPSPAERAHLGWMCYENGLFDAAQGWLDTSTTLPAEAGWVEAMLLLRDGDIDRATNLLRKVRSEVDPAETWGHLGDWIESGLVTPHSEVNADLGVIFLGQQNYWEALDAFSQSVYWEDCAYLAEQVMMTEELECYVTSNRPVLDLATPKGLYYMWDRNLDENAETVRSSLEYLLARRLAREGEYHRGLKYMPSELREEFNAFVVNYDRASAPGSRVERARAFYKAGSIARYGIALFGTELQHDWFTNEGSLRWYGFAEERLAGEPPRSDFRYPFDWEQLPDATQIALSASAGEKQRVRLNTRFATHRFNYRYLAANLMWQAAGLMPNNSPLTAHALWNGGNYLENRDPKSADRFYKTLVNRCRRLQIGREADRKRWFPSREFLPPLDELKE